MSQKHQRMSYDFRASWPQQLDTCVSWGGPDFDTDYDQRFHNIGVAMPAEVRCELFL